MLAVASDGTLSAPTAAATPPCSIVAGQGKGAHQILLDATNQFAWVPCLNDAHIAQFKLDATSGALTQNFPVNVMTTGGGGPRHLALTPDGKRAYLIEEFASMMSGYNIDAAGNLTPVGQRLSTRAPNPAGTNTGAEVQVHPSAKWVYGSNRGDNDIVKFALAADGTLTWDANYPTGGQIPWQFVIDPTGKWLLVANQASNDVRVFAINAATGPLTSVGAPQTVTAPTFIGVVTF